MNDSIVKPPWWIEVLKTHALPTLLLVALRRLPAHSAQSWHVVKPATTSWDITDGTAMLNYRATVAKAVFT